MKKLNILLLSLVLLVTFGVSIPEVAFADATLSCPAISKLAIQTNGGVVIADVPHAENVKSPATGSIASGGPGNHADVCAMDIVCTPVVAGQPSKCSPAGSTGILGLLGKIFNTMFIFL